MVGDPGQDIAEPGLRVDVVQFGSLCRAPNYAERIWEQRPCVQLFGSVERTSRQFHSA
jgi:hypothetical protein